MQQSDKSRTVIVTGGTRGIGLEIVKAFAEAGDFVVVGARENSSEIQALGERVRFVAMDVRREEDHMRLVAAAREWKSGVDIYVNNAGVSQWRTVDRIDADFWQMMLDVNLTGTFWGMKAAAAAMTSGGVVINVSSLAGKRGSANNSAYCAAKFGVNGLTQALAKELGPRGIRVNAVCPVYILTETLVESLKDPVSPAGGQDIQTYISQFAQSQAALRRMPEGHEIASFCLALASNASAAVTGQCINVDCGVLPQ